MTNDEQPAVCIGRQLRLNVGERPRRMDGESRRFEDEPARLEERRVLSVHQKAGRFGRIRVQNILHNKRFSNS